MLHNAAGDVREEHRTDSRCVLVGPSESKLASEIRLWVRIVGGLFLRRPCSALCCAVLSQPRCRQQGNGSVERIAAWGGGACVWPLPSAPAVLHCVVVVLVRLAS